MGKILLLGASGFVGKHVKNKLDDNNEDFKSLEGKDDLDIRDFDLFNEYLSKNKFEKIINCAAFVGGIAYGDEYKVELFNTNNSINKNIYEASARNNIKHIINPFQIVPIQNNMMFTKKKIFGMENLMSLYTAMLWLREIRLFI